MSNSVDSGVERFIAGEDRLAALLRALPVYEAPAVMAARFAALARVAQTAYVPAAQLTAAAPLIFEAPASLETSFLAEAARIQAAQQPRHDAVIEQVHAGKPLAEVLGHDVTAGTAAWLASRPQRIAAQAEQTAARPARASSKWWQRIGVVMASVAFGAVATNLWLARQQGAAPVATALNEAPSAPPSAALPAPVELQVEPIAQISAVTKPASPPPSDSKRVVTERLRAYAETQRAMKAEAARDDDNADAKFSREPAQDRAAEKELYAERRREELAVASARPAPAAEGRMGAAPAGVAAAPAVAPQENRARQPAAAAAPAPAAAPPAPKIAADRARTSLRFELGSAPQEAANAWLAHTREHAPRIFAANPEADAVRNWVERFRLSLPTDVRPAQIRIEQDTRLRDDALRFE